MPIRAPGIPPGHAGGYLIMAEGGGSNDGQKGEWQWGKRVMVGRAEGKWKRKEESEGYPEKEKKKKEKRMDRPMTEKEEWWSWNKDGGEKQTNMKTMLKDGSFNFVQDIKQKEIVGVLTGLKYLILPNHDKVSEYGGGTGQIIYEGQWT